MREAAGHHGTSRAVASTAHASFHELALHRSFTAGSHVGYRGFDAPEQSPAVMEVVRDAEVLHVDELEIRPAEGLVLAGGRGVAMSIHELGLLTALVRRQGRVVRREDLYALVWQAPLREGDRSIDVYVHKVRVKLEAALPDRRFIHTHVGFGYRFAPELSHAFHTSTTAPEHTPPRQGVPW
jgi:DNA-binding response OmpR family regulator